MHISPDTHVTVTDPDNFMGSPAYDGPIEDFSAHMSTGTYPATAHVPGTSEFRIVTVHTDDQGLTVWDAVTEEILVEL